MMSKLMFFFSLMAASVSAQASVDSYRFAHVTIATPWYIFLFLLIGVLAPFALMIVLAWRVAMKKPARSAQKTTVTHKSEIKSTILELNDIT